MYKNSKQYEKPQAFILLGLKTYGGKLTRFAAYGINKTERAGKSDTADGKKGKKKWTRAGTHGTVAIS